MHLKNNLQFSALLMTFTLLLGACASGGNPSSGAPGSTTGSRILACKATDRQISSSAQCLQDDAACYQTASGSWCTGERGTTCPAGSSPLPANAQCPSGARCFSIGGALNCAISFQ